MKFRFPLMLIVMAVVFIFCMPYSYASEAHVKKDSKGDWTLLVDGKPYFVRGITYIVNKVGQSPEGGYEWLDWAWSDDNGNKKIDGPYDAWVDKNGNNRQDSDEPAVGDFQLMKEMGVNTIRWYVNAFPNQKPNKELLRDLYKSYGIRVAVGDFFGAYCIGSGASWDNGTDYRDPGQQEKMLESVRRMIEEHKNEPYLLLWILGNENNYPFTKTNAGIYPEAYARFLNKAAIMIHKLDGKHPVAFVNGEDNLLKYYVKFTPDMDIFGTNSYKGPFGFQPMWKNVKSTYDKPMLITEYGCPAYYSDKDPAFGEEKQMEYHKGCWKNIEKNRAGEAGSGNAIGGIASEWLDRWWTEGEPFKHANIGHSIGPGVTNWNQEYGGFAAQGDGTQSPFLRQLRKVYFLYRDELWARKAQDK